jgi:hypothetical protein
MTTVLVTCIYNKSYVYNDTDPDIFREVRYQRFYYSLISISNTFVPIIIFTNKSNIEFVKEFCNKNLKHKQFKVVEFDITTLPCFCDLEQLKLQNSELNKPDDRYAQLVLSKPYMMHYAVKQNLFNGDNYFWIDAGLSYVSLFPKRYKTGELYDWFGYSCFDIPFITRITNYAKEKPLVIVNNSGMGTPYLYNEGIYNDVTNSTTYYTIGGLWGGYKDDVIIMCALYFVYLDRVIKSWRQNKTASVKKLFYEEPILSAMVCNEPEKYSIQRFDTWYHEDDWTQVHNIKPGDKNFYKIITGEQ